MLGGESDHKDGTMRLQTLKPRLNKLAHRLPVVTLKRLFAAVLIALAVKMSWRFFV